MTSYRTILLAGAVVLSATSAYAASSREGTVHHSAPRTHLLEGRTSQGGPVAPYAMGRGASRDPRASDYEPGSTWSRLPIQLQKRDITTEGNGNK